MYPGYPGLNQQDQQMMHQRQMMDQQMMHQHQMMMLRQDHQQQLNMMRPEAPRIPKDPAIPKFLAACRTGDLEYVNVLLERGVDVDSTDDECWTGLHVSACKGHLAVMEVLIEKGADLNPRAKREVWGPGTKTSFFRVFF